ITNGISTAATTVHQTGVWASNTAAAKTAYTTAKTAYAVGTWATNNFITTFGVIFTLHIIGAVASKALSGLAANTTTVAPAISSGLSFVATAAAAHPLITGAVVTTVAVLALRAYTGDKAYTGVSILNS
ncbi:MAG: hypothetical protein HY324_03685, partial [Chlamydiia bacterium]|nr:hypothetical protein [Chlamydiia bacterium]